MPKVLLHDHLDGGLRPATVLELADETGYDEPAARDNVGGAGGRLARPGAPTAGTSNRTWRRSGTRSAVMQSADALRRVAAECAEDLAADGVVYAEVRFAPELHTERGLSLDEVVDAVLDGFRRDGGRRQRRRRSTVYALLTAMRTAARSLEIAELAVRYRDEGVVGFDIAGAEAGWPPSRHLDAFQYVAAGELPHHHPRRRGRSGCRRSGRRVQWCGAERLGHGVRIIDDIDDRPGRATSSSAGWRPTSGTGGSRWRCARPRTSRPARPPRWPRTRSGCCASCSSGSR